MKLPSTSHRGLKLLISLGLAHVAICVVFASCGLLTPVDRPVGDSRVLNEIASGPFGSVPEKLGKAYGRHTGLKPESEWNALGLWKRILPSPPTYVPKGFSNRVPEEGPEGRWFVDPRDGKRLYAPSSPHLGYSSRTWEAEARKITAN